MLKDHFQSAAEVETDFPPFSGRCSLSVSGKDDTEQKCCPKWTKAGENLTGAERDVRSIPRVHPPMRQAHTSLSVHTEITPSLLRVPAY